MIVSLLYGCSANVLNASFERHHEEPDNNTAFVAFGLKAWGAVCVYKRSVLYQNNHHSNCYVNKVLDNTK